MLVLGKIRDFLNLEKRRNIVNSKSKKSAKTRAPTKKINETKILELNFYFRAQ